MSKDARPGQVQFISAEEMRAVAEMEAKQKEVRTVDGLSARMQTAFDRIDEKLEQDTGMGMLEHWAIKQPGEFIKLQARLAMHKKDTDTARKIFIGLPRSELDDVGAE